MSTIPAWRISTEPFPVAAVYNACLDRMNQALPAEVKDANEEFLGKFTEFFRSGIHDGILCSQKQDKQTLEKICSSCFRETATAASSKRLLVPFLDKTEIVLISCCKNTACVENVQKYIQVVSKIFGPFSSKKIVRLLIPTDKSKIIIPLFRVNGRDAPRDSETWRLGYDSVKRKIEVYVDINIDPLQDTKSISIDAIQDNLQWTAQLLNRDTPFCQTLMSNVVKNCSKIASFSRGNLSPE